MLFFIKFFFIFTCLIFSSNIGNTIFQISKIDNKSTEILFNIPQIEIEKDSDGYAVFQDDDLNSFSNQNQEFILPIYSSAFQMNPGFEYEIDFEVLSSYTIENVKLKNFNENDNIFFPEQNINLSEPQIMRGLVLGQISFTPYKFFVNENKLEVFDAVQININETNSVDYDYFFCFFVFNYSLVNFKSYK